MIIRFPLSEFNSTPFIAMAGVTVCKGLTHIPIAADVIITATNQLIFHYAWP